MLAACEAGDVFALLEGGGARDAADALYGAAREPWLTRALLHYHARTGSPRAIEVLARAPEPHARHLLDALQEQLRADAEPRRAALAALAPLVARRPAWLQRPPAAPALARDLLRAARSEREPLPLLHALLALAALLPAAPALAAPLAPELADALLRPSALDPPPAPPQRAHLQLAQLALFHALYATHPCTLLDALRGELAGAAGARDAWERGLAPLLRSVRLHPALVAGSRQREADAARWARVELHDVLAESRRLALPASARERAASPAVAPPPAPPPPASPAPGSGAAAARAAQALRPGAEPWFALAERCGADSAPHTPLPAEADAAEPPEAAVEATPENTPAKETRAQFRFPTESGAVRAIGRRSPPGPAAGAEAPAPRLARVLAERRAAESPVPFAAPPPAGVARPEPSRPAAAPEPEPADCADREVGELTARAMPEDAWPEAEAGAAERAAALDPRRGPLAPPAPAPSLARAPRPARRAASCSPPRSRSRAVAVQTLPAWPAPYEFLIADFYRGLPDDSRPQAGERDPLLPCERLDAYLSELYAGGGGGGGLGGERELAEQLQLVHAQLMYERWRREAHAERNRRLLGRCRQARALELQNAALRERLRQAARDQDELRARMARERPPAAPGPQAPEREAQLEAALQAERDARARAEAALHEAERARAQDAAELQRTRGESFEAARHVEALARAALAAERRAEHVRRLRRELLVLAEREARLGEAAKAAAGAGARGHLERAAAEERALRAACARAEADAAAATTRADAAAARAHELEAALAARDAVVADLKRATRHAAEEHAAELRAMRDKYEALMRVVRAAEAKALERLAGRAEPRRGPPLRPAAEAGEGAAARGARLLPADCRRTRRLLDPDAEPAPHDG